MPSFFLRKALCHKALTRNTRSRMHYLGAMNLRMHSFDAMRFSSEIQYNYSLVSPQASGSARDGRVAAGLQDSSRGPVHGDRQDIGGSTQTRAGNGPAVQRG